MSQIFHNSIFWVETDKIKPNPYQPRKEFDQDNLRELSDSIRQYGVLQPLVVTRREFETESGLAVEYELIAGERRLRASKLAGLPQVPVIIRAHTEDPKLKLELAIIENLQREDLNPIDRAVAFDKLANEFNFSHAEIGKKMGKSREYVSNSLRLLALPEHIKQALIDRRITEGHTRPLMMLASSPDQQETLFKELMVKKLSVRETEKIAKSLIAPKSPKPVTTVGTELDSYAEKLAESLGTRVSILPENAGGKIVIDFFSPTDLEVILKLVKANQVSNSPDHIQTLYQNDSPSVAAIVEKNDQVEQSNSSEQNTLEPVVLEPLQQAEQVSSFEETPANESFDMLDDRSKNEVEDAENKNDDDLYNMNNLFTI